MDNEGRINNEPPQMDNEPAAQAQPEFQMSESTEMNRAKKDALAQSWVEEQLGAEKKREQIIAEFMAGGASIKNYVTNNEEIWKPQLAGDDGEKKMVFLTGYLGTTVSISILRNVLKLALEMPQSKRVKGTDLCMLPYPRFTKEGEIDAPESNIIVLSGEQVQNLQELLSSLDSQE